MIKKVHISRSHKEAEEYDIKQHIEMTPDERLAAAKKLKEKVCGKSPPDIREVYKKNINRPKDSEDLKYLLRLKKY